MRTVTYDELLAHAAALYDGTQVSDLDAARKANLTAYLTQALRYAWQWAEWPELMVTETRTPVSGFLDWAGSGGLTTGTVLAVTQDNPDSVTNPRPVLWRYDTNGLGLRILGTTTDAAVWVRYLPTAPRLTSTAYNSGTAYTAGMRVYHASTGECYQALQSTTGNAPTNTTYWRKLDVPMIFLEAVATGAVALKRGTGGEHAAEQILKTAMDDLLAAEAEQFRRRAGQVQSLAVRAAY